MSKEPNRVPYPELTLIVIEQRQTMLMASGPAKVLFYPEAAVKAHLNPPTVKGEVECTTPSGYCLAIRVRVNIADLPVLFDWASATSGVHEKGEGVYVVQDRENLPNIVLTHDESDRSETAWLAVETVSGLRGRGADADLALAAVYHLLKRYGYSDNPDDYIIKG